MGTKEAAEKAMAELDAGRPFEVVAQEINMDASKKRGGDIGWYPRGRLVPTFETVAFALQKGEVSDIVSPTSWQERLSGFCWSKTVRGKTILS